MNDTTDVNRCPDCGAPLVSSAPFMVCSKHCGYGGTYPVIVLDYITTLDYYVKFHVEIERREEG